MRTLTETNQHTQKSNCNTKHERANEIKKNEKISASTRPVTFSREIFNWVVEFTVPTDVSSCCLLVRMRMNECKSVTVCSTPRPNASTADCTSDCSQPSKRCGCVCSGSRVRFCSFTSISCICSSCWTTFSRRSSLKSASNMTKM
jgi:hypothetical protein